MSPDHKSRTPMDRLLNNIRRFGFIDTLSRLMEKKYEIIQAYQLQNASRKKCL